MLKGKGGCEIGKVRNQLPSLVVETVDRHFTSSDFRYIYFSFLFLVSAFVTMCTKFLLAGPTMCLFRVYVLYCFDV